MYSTYNSTSTLLFFEELTFLRRCFGFFMRLDDTCRIDRWFGALRMASLYFCLKSVAVALKSAIFFQQVFIEQEPETPWHLHLSIICEETASMPTWKESLISTGIL